MLRVSTVGVTPFNWREEGGGEGGDACSLLLVCGSLILWIAFGDEVYCFVFNNNGWWAGQSFLMAGRTNKIGNPNLGIFAVYKD